MEINTVIREHIAQILDENDPEGGAIADNADRPYEFWYPQAEAIIKAGYGKVDNTTVVNNFSLLHGKASNKSNEIAERVVKLLKDVSSYEVWIIRDILDGATVAEFSDTTHFNPEERARELFAVYPRKAELLVRTVIRNQYEVIDKKD